MISCPRLAGRSAHQLPYLNLILPIGLSFHTFQAMQAIPSKSDRGHQPAERHFGIYALYVKSDPQLVGRTHRAACNICSPNSMNARDSMLQIYLPVCA